MSDFGGATQSEISDAAISMSAEPITEALSVEIRAAKGDECEGVFEIWGRVIGACFGEADEAGGGGGV
jgi:hypothetical protein